MEELPVTQLETIDFSQCISSCALNELNFTGSSYTWWNRRIEVECIFKRLYKVFGNDEFMNLLPSSEVHHLIRQGSDHAHLHVICNTSHEHVIKPFRFLNFWTKHESFKSIITDVWKEDKINDRPFMLVYSKMKRVKAWRNPPEMRGATKMYRDLREVYWWNGMKRDIAYFVAKCPNCQQVKVEHQKSGNMTQEIDIPTWKWEVINMDFITGLPRTRRQHDSIWVIVDRVTKFSHFLAVKSTDSAEDYAKLYINEIVRLHGVPLSIISDRDQTTAHAGGPWFTTATPHQTQIRKSVKSRPTDRTTVHRSDHDLWIKDPFTQPLTQMTADRQGPSFDPRSIGLT
ncbi:hypothetical protein MTR67_040593, partial [Solanum verrucosum]